MFEENEEYLEEEMLSHFSFDISYFHDEDEYIMKATTARAISKSVDASGVVIISGSFDFIISSSYFSFSPTTGDYILYDSKKYEVCNLPGEPCFRPTSVYRKNYRIHTMEVKI